MTELINMISGIANARKNSGRESVDQRHITSLLLHPEFGRLRPGYSANLRHGIIGAGLYSWPKKCRKRSS